MKPPICGICRKRFSPFAGDNKVRFSDYKPLEKGIVGHPHGLVWFCPEHIVAARALSHLPEAEALKKLRGLS